MQGERNYGVDLLRVVLMFCIVVGHLYAHTEIRSLLPFLSGKWVFTWLTQTVTVCAVNCFVIITGYYMTRAKYDLYKLIKLWGEVIFYSIAVTILLVVICKITISPGLIINAFFPVFRQEYWFFTMYILLYLLVPFLNVGLNRMSKRMHRVLVVIIMIFFYIEPLGSALFFEYDNTEGFSIVAFITLYIIGSYLAKCRDLSKRNCVLVLAVSSLIMFTSKILLQHIVDKYSLGLGTGLLYHNNSIFVLINAIALFELFKQKGVNTHLQKCVSWMSSSVFAVYLLHEKPAMREIIWNQSLVKCLTAANLPLYLLAVIGIGIGILIVGILIDKFMVITVFSWIKRSKIANSIRGRCEKYNAIIAEVS